MWKDQLKDKDIIEIIQFIFPPLQSKFNSIKCKKGVVVLASEKRIVELELQKTQESSS